MNPVQLKYQILAGTHHKTGTYWLSNILKQICSENNLTYYMGKQENLPENCDVFFSQHSEFILEKIAVPYRGVHLIRDPRDVIISACFYHMKSTEKWLHVKRKIYDDMTYQEKLNNLPTLEEKIMCELLRSEKKLVSQMQLWNYQNPLFIEIKYEDLIRDFKLVLFKKIFKFLGFPKELIPRILEICYENSLFSGRVKKITHIRPGQAGEWKKYFSAGHKEKFLELFGNLLIDLGYEKNNDWAK